MSWDQYSQTPASNDLPGYFKPGMLPSSVKTAGWDIMADLAQFMSLPTSSGTANAQTVTNTRQFGALFTGMRQSFIPGNTNTGACTLAVDGLTAKNVYANGAAIIAGMLVSGVAANVQYDGTQWQLLNPQRSTGSFTITLTGMTAGTTGTANYAIAPDGKSVEFWIASAITGTSNSAAMTGTGIPSAIQPVTVKRPVGNWEDNTAGTAGVVSVAAASGTWTWSVGAGLAGGGFTTSGTKGLPAGCKFSYALD